MPLTMTYGDVRQLIEAEQLGWQPRADMPDYVRLPDYALGASTEGLVPTADAPALDLRTLGVGTNPFLAVRRFERGIVSVDAVLESFSSRLLRQLDLDDRLDAVAGPFTDAAYGGETASAAPPEGGHHPTRSTGETGGARTGSLARGTRTPVTHVGLSPAPLWWSRWFALSMPCGLACRRVTFTAAWARLALTSAI